MGEIGWLSLVTQQESSVNYTLFRNASTNLTKKIKPKIKRKQDVEKLFLAKLIVAKGKFMIW